jgi:hypothetical protein
LPRSQRAWMYSRRYRFSYSASPIGDGAARVAHEERADALLDEQLHSVEDAAIGLNRVDVLTLHCEDLADPQRAPPVMSWRARNVGGV